MGVLIKNGRVVDPSQSLDMVSDIYVQGDRVKEISERIDTPRKSDTVIDASGQIVAPGLVDIHVHLREPGYEHKETIRTGCLAAAAGGFTSIVCMPNTNPINDNASVTEYILLKARTEGIVNVFPIGAITKGEKGAELADIGEMCEAGCVAISDDGMPVTDSGLMRKAMEYVRPFGIPVITHAEDIGLSAGGVMNEGFVSTELGLRGIPAASEEVGVVRDIILCELTGTPLHICHVSTKGSVRLVREAKKRGAKVTAEATPHHFTLTDKLVYGYNTDAKMNPPLRTQEDVDAILEGIADGTIDVIATDHAPHSQDEKNVEFDLAPFGIVGLETALSLSLELVEKGIITLEEMIKKLTVAPSEIVGIERGTLVPGSIADLVVFDPGMSRTVNPEEFFSKSRNTPFSGWELKGVVSSTIVSGKVVFSRKN
ncbi:MAG: dihydroorotase [Candidatus Dadabacteria bacterium]|nr:dihydroorotase [Candidatus Dadabacteria bacterium]MDE0477838.1 dihydroorotase [Candidatus Dadabacteria bacterium]